MDYRPTLKNYGTTTLSNYPVHDRKIKKKGNIHGTETEKINVPANKLPDILI